MLTQETCKTAWIKYLHNCICNCVKFFTPETMPICPETPITQAIKHNVLCVAELPPEMIEVAPETL